MSQPADQTARCGDRDCTDLGARVPADHQHTPYAPPSASPCPDTPRLQRHDLDDVDGLEGEEDLDEEPMEVVAYAVYQWDCVCGEVNTVDHDPTGEIVECEVCDTTARVEGVR